MSGSGGSAVSRRQSGDRFYNPPAIRRHQQQLLLQQQQQQQQQQLQRQQNRNHYHHNQQQLQGPLKSEHRAESVEAETRTDSDDSTLSKPSVCSSSPPRPSNLTNIDRLVESVTLFVPAQYFTEPRMRGCRIREADMHPFFCLGDLWDCFKEWSAYGVGVPLLLHGSDSVKQYYVPSLSGIQLYIDPLRLRRPGEESDAESSRETSSGGSSDCEVERQTKCFADGARSQLNLVNLSSQRMKKLSLQGTPPMSSSSDEAEVSNSTGMLIFEYLEQEQPHHRKPLFDKISVLASQFPELKMYKSCDLSPSSWISVAWYPIYRIPMGPTLQNLDASFLTFHSLSTHSRSRPQFHGSAGRKFNAAADSSSKISLPVFGLASYKLTGSFLTSSGPYELQQAKSLVEAADNWLRRLQVNLPDYQFFISHNSHLR
ncbi:hypothetical protein L1049_003722 [Liquidambar formosana]|uniref:Uncharacterized protein n=1 Tax=Liquidambar formosana TaxID=63359 RepID=A0AAP0RMX1_LIQFO